MRTAFMSQQAAQPKPGAWTPRQQSEPPRLTRPQSQSPWRQPPMQPPTPGQVPLSQAPPMLNGAVTSEMSMSQTQRTETHMWQPSPQPPRVSPIPGFKSVRAPGPSVTEQQQVPAMWQPAQTAPQQRQSRYQPR